MQRTFKDIVKEQIPPQIMLVIAFVIMLVVGYCAWSILTAGTVTVNAPFFESEIYIDGVKVGTSREAPQKMVFEYPIGKHEIIVSKSGFWPWMQNVEVSKEQPVILDPFLIQKTLRTEQIPASAFDGERIKPNQDYSAVLSLFADIPIPQQILTILDETNIKNVRSADFFPGRSDVLIIAANQNIFAIDTKYSDPRNYQPIFSGSAPIFVKTQDGSIYVKDGNAIFIVKDLVPQK